MFLILLERKKSKTQFTSLQNAYIDICKYTIKLKTPKTKTHTKKWLQATCLTIVYSWQKYCFHP
jgi:hypothetical protein